MVGSLHERPKRFLLTVTPDDFEEGGFLRRSPVGTLTVVVGVRPSDRCRLHRLWLPEF